MNSTCRRSGLLASTLLAASLCASQSPAQPLPRFRAIPQDAQLRLEQAVERRVRELEPALDAGDGLARAVHALEQPAMRQSLWASIEGEMNGTLPPRGAGAALIDVLDGAIGAYMTELGRITYEIDAAGRADALDTLAPLHPGDHGSGRIDLGQVGEFRGITVTFRGEIAHPDGRAPAVVAFFYLLPARSGEPPTPGRLLIPIAGAGPSFRAPLRTAGGAEEIRDYGWRPHLTRTSAVLELRVDNAWMRVENPLDVSPRRRIARDPVGFCDVTTQCSER
jgi:hypothetical protein